jgi:hypothetical protein
VCNDHLRAEFSVRHVSRKEFVRGSKGVRGQENIRVSGDNVKSKGFGVL